MAAAPKEVFPGINIAFFIDSQPLISYRGLYLGLLPRFFLFAGALFHDLVSLNKKGWAISPGIRSPQKANCPD